MIQYEHRSPNGNFDPTVWHSTLGQTCEVDDICKWLAEQEPEISKILDSEGALVIRGFTSLTTPKDFDRAIRSISPDLRNYLGGTSPRRQVYGRIMTATEVPPSWSIPLHQEMAYTKDPPHRIAFFCQQPAPTGGLSTLGDMGHVLKRISPDVRDKFERHGLQLRRSLPSEATRDHKPGVKKLWSEVFGTPDRGRVDEILAENGWRGNWLGSETLQVWHEVLPATRQHPVSKRKVWFNQAHFFSPVCMMAWARRDGRLADWAELDDARRRHPEMLDNMFYGNGEAVSDAEATHVHEVLQESEIPVRLQSSDILILDNVLVAHGRTAYSGYRAILVALVDVSRLRSRR